MKISSHSHWSNDIYCFDDEVHTQKIVIFEVFTCGQSETPLQTCNTKIALRRPRDMGAFRHVLLHILVCVCTICI